MKKHQHPFSRKLWIFQRIIGFNRTVPWQVHFTSTVICPERISVGEKTSPGYMPGCYIQAINGIEVGDFTRIGPNVGLISANHDPYDNRRHKTIRPIKIGKYCWIGMGAVILPGVELGEYTVVATNAVVARSFKRGYCVIGGNPATFLYSLDKTKCINYGMDYIGHISR